MRSPENMLMHEIVGLDARIVESTDPTLQDNYGTIVLETRNTIWLRTDSGLKQIAKKAATKIEIKTHYGVCFISGSSIIGRSEDRISRLGNW